MLGMWMHCRQWHETRPHLRFHQAKLHSPRSTSSNLKKQMLEPLESLTQNQATLTNASIFNLIALYAPREQERRYNTVWQERTSKSTPFASAPAPPSATYPAPSPSSARPPTPSERAQDPRPRPHPTPSQSPCPSNPHPHSHSHTHSHQARRASTVRRHAALAACHTCQLGRARPRPAAVASPALPSPSPCTLASHHAVVHVHAATSSRAEHSCFPAPHAPFQPWPGTGKHPSISDAGGPRRSTKRTAHACASWSTPTVVGRRHEPAYWRSASDVQQPRPFAAFPPQSPSRR